MEQVLLVEGKDDLFVFSNIFEKNKVKETFEIIEKNGIEQLFKSIPIYTKTEKSTIGIIIDADIDIKSRWNTVRSILEQLGYTNISDNAITEGLILTNPHLPKIGVWIMPNNQENGMLEDFVKHLIPEDDMLIPFVDKTLTLLEEKGLQKYKHIHKSKARIHTWLAWQEDPGTPMGLAINKKYLNTDNPQTKIFINWINELYN